MSDVVTCPECKSEYTYLDREMYICSMCAHEWSSKLSSESNSPIYKDANGNVLEDGDSVSVIKELKVKGTNLVVKIGTKVKSIRLVEGDHNIDCKIKGIGPMKLKSEFVKKSK